MTNKNSEKLINLIKKATKLRIPIQNLPVVTNSFVFQKICIKFGIIYFISLLCVTFIYNLKFVLTDKDCFVPMPSSLSHSFREPEHCDFCRHVQRIPYIDNISPTEFERNFAYNGQPVIVTDAMSNWTAPNVFDFWYFKSIYEESQKDNEQLNCQFFPYKTDFKNLYEALSIPKERVNYEQGYEPWYFGWSNCNYDVAQQLRRHYGRPYFLPETSENNAVDWIFMGGPGLGAHMHVDNVRLPSWQAQIKGEKEWTLAPPPECYYFCRFHKVIVKTGDIST